MSDRVLPSHFFKTEMEVHETTLCHHTHIHFCTMYIYQIGPFEFRLLVRTLQVDHLYLLLDHTCISHQEGRTCIIPPLSIINGQLCSVLTSNLNLKGPTWLICVYDTVLFHAPPSLFLKESYFFLNSVQKWNCNKNCDPLS